MATTPPGGHLMKVLSGNDHNATRSTDQPPRQGAFSIYMIVVTSLLIAMIEVGNIITLVAVATHRPLRKKRYTLVISLAVTDCFVGVSAAILLVKYVANCDHSNVDNLVLDIIMRIPILASILHLVVMSVDRFIAVHWPFRYERVVTTAVLRAGSALCWLVAILMGLLYLIWLPRARSDTEECHWQGAPLTFSIPMEFAIYCLAAIFMTILYGKILCIARAHARKIAAVSGAPFRKVTSGALKGTRLVLFLLGAYVLTWLPYFVVYFLIIVHGYTDRRTILGVAVVHFGLINSWLNVLIYGWVNADFKRAYHKVLCCACAEYGASVNGEQITS